MFMKREFSFLWVSLALLATLQACTPAIQSAQTPGSALIRVECENASANGIVQLFRGGRGKDITTVASDRAVTRITAAFSPEYTPPYRFAQLMRDLNNLPGVLNVEVVENPRPILQNF